MKLICHSCRLYDDLNDLLEKKERVASLSRAMPKVRHLAQSVHTMFCNVVGYISGLRHLYPPKYRTKRAGLADN